MIIMIITIVTITIIMTIILIIIMGKQYDNHVSSFAKHGSYWVNYGLTMEKMRYCMGYLADKW